MDLDQTLIEVWRQALVERRNQIELHEARFPVRFTAKKNLRQIDFQFAGEAIRGLEQNPNTESRWAKLAREGAKVMQFLSQGRYFANVVDGKLTFYGERSSQH
jgi:hypothetical protein